MSVSGSSSEMCHPIIITIMTCRSTLASLSTLVIHRICLERSSPCQVAMNKKLGALAQLLRHFKPDLQVNSAGGRM
jgi:hypothetical protein